MAHEIRVIAPAESFADPQKTFAQAIETLERETGYSITFGKNAGVVNEKKSSSTDERIRDLHDAFTDNNVALIMSVSGGFNSNDLLPYIDWDLIRKNPKPFIGSSDITVLVNAIYKMTGIKTFYGPNFFKYGMKKGLDYTLEYFKKSVMSDSVYVINPSEVWSDDKWYFDQENRQFKNNDGFWVCNSGEAEGILIGGHLSSLNLLQGTPYMPSLENSILLVEEDVFGKNCYGEFKRNLQSLLQTVEGDSIKGILVGRFHSSSEMSKDDVVTIIQSIKQISNIPIVANVDFGHTDPGITFPIGGHVKLSVSDDDVCIQVGG